MAVAAHLRAAHADKGRISIRLLWMRGAGEHRHAHQPGGYHSAVEIVGLVGPVNGGLGTCTIGLPCR